MYIEILLWILAVLLVVVGMESLVFPALPGAPVLYAGQEAVSWAEDFEHISTGTLVVLGVMAALTYLVDFLAGAFGAKRFGASRRCGSNSGPDSGSGGQTQPGDCHGGDICDRQISLEVALKLSGSKMR